MTFDEYQAAALTTSNPELDKRDRLLDAAAGLAEEASEVLGVVRKRVFQQREVPRERFVEELGDTLWCLAVTADSLGISFDEIARTNVAKLRERHPRGFTRPDDRAPEDWSRSSRE